MACYKPLKAFQCANGDVVFVELRRHDIIKNIELPCGQCIGCRLERSRQWAMRCVHEASLYNENCFITLTYDDNNIPQRGQLNYRDFQLFIKRLRKNAGKRLRFYMGAEYGETTWRPHYHACIFGYDWPDKKYLKLSESGEKLYTSETLEKLWTYGMSSTANLTFESAAYVARYCMKKVNGDAAENHYKRHDEQGEYQLTPEFSRMSLKPGIGAEWLKIYEKDVYTHDYVVINGHETRPPKYYDKLMKRKNADKLENIKEERIIRAMKHAENNTDERLKVREEVTKARSNQLYRNSI